MDKSKKMRRVQSEAKNRESFVESWQGSFLSVESEAFKHNKIRKQNTIFESKVQEYNVIFIDNTLGII